MASEKLQESQESTQLQSEFQTQVSVLNLRIGNVNLSINDMLKEMDKTFRTMATIVNILQKENTELKAKAKETVEVKKSK